LKFWTKSDLLALTIGCTGYCCIHSTHLIIPIHLHLYSARIPQCENITSQSSRNVEKYGKTFQKKNHGIHPWFQSSFTAK
jgi:hypothetical protein